MDGNKLGMIPVYVCSELELDAKRFCWATPDFDRTRRSAEMIDMFLEQKGMKPNFCNFRFAFQSLKNEGVL